MKVKGLDRIVILVKDMEKALDLFSNKLGMKFMELDKEISARDGLRSYVCLETHVHLMSPILPLPENAALPIRKKVELLNEKEAIVMALTFIVDDVEEVAGELTQNGINIQQQYKKSHDYASSGLDNFEEVVPDEKETLGIVMGFAAHDQKKNNMQREVNKIVQPKGIDRIVIMVRDIDKALDFFSNKLGMVFRELDDEISKRDGNRGFVCHETNLHLIALRLPLPENAPLPMRKGAELIQDKEAMVLVLIFKQDNPMNAATELKNEEFNILRTWEDNHDYVSVGMDNLYEFLIDPKDTMGLSICMSDYDCIL